MSFRVNATREAAVFTQGTSLVTNHFTRPSPAVTFLDFDIPKWHQVAGSHNCLAFSHNVGPMKVRHSGERGWREWERGSMMTGPGFELNIEAMGGLRAHLAFISTCFIETVLEYPIEAARFRSVTEPDPELRIVRWLLNALREDVAAGAPNGPILAESVAGGLIATVSERSVTLAVRAPLPRTAVGRLPDFIAAHLHEALNLERIAAAAGISVRHLTGAFRKTFGHSVHQYVLRRRVERAIGLLRLGMPAADVADLSGLADTTSLARALRNVAGTTVRQARAGTTSFP